MRDDYSRLPRRSFLTKAGVALSLGLAGCGAPETQSESAGVDVAPPTVRSSAIDAWEQIDTRSQTHSFEKFGINVTAHERTKIYQNSQLAQQVKEETLGQFDSTLAMFFASHLDLRGVATIAATPDQIANVLLPRFEEQMANSGITTVQEVSVSSPSPSYSDSSSIVEYRGQFSTPTITKEVPIEDVGTKTVEIPAGQLPVSGLVSVWKTGTGTAFAAGSAFPAADYEEADTLSVTSEEGDGIDITVSIDLGLGVRELRREVVEMMQQVGISSGE